MEAKIVYQFFFDSEFLAQIIGQNLVGVSEQI